MLGITEDEMRGPPRKKKRRGITWNEEEEIINPEDVDPSVGRFRNLVHTTIIPSRVTILSSIHLFNCLFKISSV